MPPPGPPRTPLKVLDQRDSPVAKKRRKQGVPDPEGRPSCPSFVPKRARKYWHHLVPELEKMGVLARIDRNSLARYCTQLWLYERAVKVLAGKGETVQDSDGFDVDRPEVKRAIRIADGLLRLEKEFGMTAAARSNLLRAAGGKPKPSGKGKGRFFERTA